MTTNEYMMNVLISDLKMLKSGFKVGRPDIVEEHIDKMLEFWPDYLKKIK